MRDTGVALEDDEWASEGLTVSGVAEGGDEAKRDTGELTASAAVEDECEGKGLLTVPKGHRRSLLSESESSNT